MLDRRGDMSNGTIFVSARAIYTSTRKAIYFNAVDFTSPQGNLQNIHTSQIRFTFTCVLWAGCVIVRGADEHVTPLMGDTVSSIAEAQKCATVTRTPWEISVRPLWK